MKYLTVLLSSFLVALPVGLAKAQDYVEAADVGNLMGAYMCESLATTGVVNDEDFLEGFALDVEEEFEEEDAEELISFFTFLADTAEDLRNESPEEFIDFMIDFVEDEDSDEFDAELVAGVLEYFNEDEECLDAFLD